MNTITYNQMFEAARVGYPVRVVINGETYNFDFGYDTEPKKIKDFNDLEFDEFCKVWENSEELRQDAWDSYLDDITDDVWSVAYALNLTDYEFSYCGCRCYVRQGDYKKFLESCVDLQDDCGFFADADFAKIERAAARAEFFADALEGFADISDDKFAKLEKWMDSIVEDICRSICDIFRSEFDAADDPETLKYWAFEIYTDRCDYLVDVEHFMIVG